MNTVDSSDRARLSLLWAAHLAAFGCVFPLLPIWLEQQMGLDRRQIGCVMAVLPLTGLMAQPFWGALADRTGRRRDVMIGLLVASAAALYLCSLADGFLAILLAAGLLAVFWLPIVPLLTAATFARMGPLARASFGSIRIWGTIGFLLGIEATAHWSRLDPLIAAPILGGEPFFVFASALCLLAACTAWLVTDAGELRLRSTSEDKGRLLATPSFRRLLVFAFIANLAMQGPCQQLSLILGEAGATRGEVGVTWRWMLVLEVVVIFLTWRLTSWLGAVGLVRLGLVSEGMRWALTASLPGLLPIQVIQGLHGIGVTGLLVGFPMLLERDVERRLRSSGQALLSAAGVGVGAVVSNLLIGFAFEALGTSLPLYAAATIQLALLAATFRFLR